MFFSSPDVGYGGLPCSSHTLRNKRYHFSGNFFSKMFKMMGKIPGNCPHSLGTERRWLDFKCTSVLMSGRDDGKFCPD